MSFTNAQARRILNVKGQPFIDPDRLPHLGMRLTETYLRRRLYAWEDKAIGDQWRAFDGAHAAIREYALRLADRQRLDTLTRDTTSLQWQQAVMGMAQQQLQQAVIDTSQQAFRYALTAWYAGYYGKAWQLDSVTREDITVKVPLPSSLQAHQQVLLPDVREAVATDNRVYAQMGDEWRQRYADELAEMLVKVRRGLTRSVSENHTPMQALRQMRDSIGIAGSVQAGFTANFYKMQSLSRTAIMNGAQDGAEALWQANRDPQSRQGSRIDDVIGTILLSQVRWVTANDERVCAICRGLDGRINSLFNIFREQPPAHPNCRCSEVPVIIEALLIDPDRFPNQTFDEWLSGVGGGLLLDDFMNLGLMSTQV